MSTAQESVLVVGAGPAGMTAAGFAAAQGKRVLLLEKEDRAGKKLRITGKGRCNVTNDCDLETLIRSTPTNGRFLYGAFSRFSPQDTMAFLEGLGVPLKVERGRRVFPVSDRAADVAEALLRFVEQSGCRLIRGRAGSLLLEDGGVRGVQTEAGETIEAGAVVLATGGRSYPGTGSTGDGYRLARQAGHTVVEPKASLVPLVAQDGFCRELMGLSLRNISVRVEELESGKLVYEDFGELLFTHFGLSGPVILSASAHMRGMRPGKYAVLIDLKPALTEEQLDQRLQRDFLKFQNRDFINSLSELLPRKLIPAAVRLSGIGGEKKCNAVTREERLRFGRLLKRLPVRIEGFRPVEEAIVTSGGVSVKEVSPKTMESRLVRGLYFAGELLDVDAYTGGFNLQIAFSTGWLAGNSV